MQRIAESARSGEAKCLFALAMFVVHDGNGTGDPHAQGLYSTEMVLMYIRGMRNAAEAPLVDQNRRGCGIADSPLWLLFGGNSHNSEVRVQPCTREYPTTLFVLTNWIYSAACK